MTNRLYRSRKDRMVGGVCGGLGAYFGIDPVIVRLVFVAITIWGGVGLLLYLVMWIIVPAEERSGAATGDVIGANVGEIERTAEDLAQEARGVFGGETRTTSQRTMWAAGALIVVGALMLLNNITGLDLGRLWPALLILLGGFLLYQAAQRR